MVTLIKYNYKIYTLKPKLRIQFIHFVSTHFYKTLKIIYKQKLKSTQKFINQPNEIINYANQRQLGVMCGQIHALFQRKLLHLDWKRKKRIQSKIRKRVERSK